MSTGGSRLAEMQARFQQKQLMEKEQKLLKMYEANQARALGRLGAGQTPAAPTGKVRQMFEERRTKAGIDKSYPLQPLPGAPGTTTNSQIKIARMTVNGHSNSGEKTSKQDVTIEIKHATTTNGDTIVKNQRYEMKSVRDINLNENFTNMTIEDDIDSVGNKLPNVGGTLPSQRVVKKETNNNTRNGVLQKKTNGDIGTPKEKLITSQRITKTPPLQAIKTTKVVKSTVSNPVKSRSVAPSPSQSISSHSPTPVSTPTKPKTPIEKIKSPVKTSSPIMASKPRPASGDDENTCSICNRTFAPDRIKKHEEICSKTSSKKRKQYDAVKHRTLGTEVESYVRQAKRTTGRAAAAAKNSPPAKQSNWRKKHEEFINAIRAAKQVQAHINKGGKLSDLPPPPPSDTSDYIACPHCNRRFNQAAAERHIPKCANFQFNKPKPVAKKR